ncbi:hypothetical protein [Parabacteroides bouchesdurhonensis]|uniref:hypothetical protein n=1 Tax=Parabacteroides bouchesdurhonensis TaxID=1936995 RepID=UPI000C827AB9|nr:hypothetical protein [Parabacteroides bouchesdurhonensis]
MKRDKITIGENGVTLTGSEVWMTAMELAELFGTTAGAVNAGIKAIIKSDTLHDYEVCKYVRLENGNGADVYNMEAVVALAFRIHAQGAMRLREYILRTLGTMSKRPAINILMTCSRKTDEYSRHIPN